MTLRFSAAFLIVILLLSACKKEDFKNDDNQYSTENTINWMQDLIAKYPNTAITLKNISIPRAHDAGVYELNNCTGGNACNTQTQGVSMQPMLESGIRMFDLRPRLIQGEYWTFHRTSCGGLGCEGATLQSFLAETKAYLDVHNELVILEVSHLCNTSSQDPGLIAMFENELGDRIYKQNSPLSQDFINTPLDEIIPPSNSSGKVLLLFEDISLATQDESRGLFARSYIPVSGGYSNSPDVDYVISDQMQKMQSFNPGTNRLFELSYTFTLDNANAVMCLSNREFASSIEELALEGRDRLSETLNSWISAGTITSAKIPNIISIDYCNTIVTKECIRLSELSLN